MDERGAWRTVAALAGLNRPSFIDRQLLRRSPPLLIAELGLCGRRSACSSASAFMSLYAVGTLAAGVLRRPLSASPRSSRAGLGAVERGHRADRHRPSGFASLSFWRGLVGIGEATLPATALSMIGTGSPVPAWALRNGLFYAGDPGRLRLSFALAGAGGAPLRVAGVLPLPRPRGLVGWGWCGAWPTRPGAGRRGGAFRAAGHGARRAARRRRAPALSLRHPWPGPCFVYASASSQHTITWLWRSAAFPFPRAAFLSAAITLAAGLAATSASARSRTGRIAGTPEGGSSPWPGWAPPASPAPSSSTASPSPLPCFSPRGSSPRRGSSLGTGRSSPSSTRWRRRERGQRDRPRPARREPRGRGGRRLGHRPRRRPRGAHPGPVVEPRPRRRRLALLALVGLSQSRRPADGSAPLPSGTPGRAARRGCAGRGCRRGTGRPGQGKA